MESEFFGHAQGAFTGAGKGRQGLFREAEGGSLLLDEISEMPLFLQAKLLRVLQDGKLRRVGENTEYQLDVRILAATHKDIEEGVQKKFQKRPFFSGKRTPGHAPCTNGKTLYSARTGPGKRE